MHPPHMGLFHAQLFENVFLELAVIFRNGCYCRSPSFMTRDVFAAAPSVLTSGPTDSVTLFDESESSQREVVTDL